jgi:recombination protein RecA
MAKAKTETKPAPKKAAKKKAAKKTTTKKAAPKGGKGKLGQARALLNKALKSNDWESNLDPKAARLSLPHLPTGSMIIDYLIGGKPNRHGVPPCPGLPKGKILNLYGHEGSGKTTIALTAAATTLAKDPNAAVCYIDWEHEVVPDYASALGVPIGDADRFMLCQPDTLDEGIAILWTMASAGVDLIVLDSVGAGVPKAYFEKSVAETADQGRVGMNAAVWSQFLPKLKGRINKTGTAIIGISQIRSAINTRGYGDPITVQGGKAWKFYSALRMKLQRVKTEKNSDYSTLTNKTEERVTGAIIKAKLDKCKVSPQQGNEELFYIRWGEGIDDLRSMIEIGVSHKVIQKSGSWIGWNKPDGDELRMQGMEKFRKAIMEDKKLQKALEKQIKPYMAAGGGGGDAAADEDGPEVFEGEGIVDDAELAEILGSISGDTSTDDS